MPTKNDRHYYLYNSDASQEHCDQVLFDAIDYLTEQLSGDRYTLLYSDDNASETPLFALSYICVYTEYAKWRLEDAYRRAVQEKGLDRLLLSLTDHFYAIRHELDCATLGTHHYLTKNKPLRSADER